MRIQGALLNVPRGPPGPPSGSSLFWGVLCGQGEEEGNTHTHTHNHQDTRTQHNLAFPTVMW